MIFLKGIPVGQEDIQSEAYCQCPCRCPCGSLGCEDCCHYACDHLVSENNQKFRKVAESNGYGHVYMEGPGDHEWPYWDKMIQRAIQFFLNLDLQTTKLY